MKPFMPIAITTILLASMLSACTSDNAGESSASPSSSAAASPIASAAAQSAVPAPTFENVSVHDPSVIKVKDEYYVFGSHLASAKSKDLLSWTQVSNIVNASNPLIPDVFNELKETLTWAQSQTLWAPDVVQLADGKYYMYYDACRGDSPLSALGVAVSDNIEGPYKNKAVLLKSGMVDEPSADGTPYDATQMPNVVDPNVFFDKEGKLWMVYGSYSGGIFILKMDPATGLPFPNQGYGKKLLGGNHSRIEGSYMLYSPETDYYYLFLSFGGLDANGGYNMRIARSKNPDGPFLDPMGQDMIDAHGKVGTVFDDASIEPYGGKIMGNFNFVNVEGEPQGSTGYVSPGHNSAYYDKDAHKYYLFFHARFPDQGEHHEVRVHQMFMNADGWLVAAPHRYSGETIGKYTAQDVTGTYKFINHGRDISAEMKTSVPIQLNADGLISGDVKGTWKLVGDNQAELAIDDAIYKGVFIREWNEATQSQVMTFTAMSKEGITIWGSHTAAAAAAGK